MSRYRIAAAAQCDLEEIWLFIAKDNPRAADEWLAEVENRFRLLAGTPLVGQERNDLALALRFLPVGNYLIFYLPLTDGIEVLRVIHGARDYGPDFF